MTRIAVVTDSTADIPPELLQQYDIRMVPLSIRIGGAIYQDRVTISPAEFMDRLVSSEEPLTIAQPSASEFRRVYDDLARDYDGIISIHISSRLSGAFQSACEARDALEDRLPITVIDSHSASMGMGFPVLLAAKLAQESRSLDEIRQATIAACEASQVILLVDTLEYLQRGGRIGRAAGLVGTVLQLKPILRIEEGIIVPLARTRTRPRAAASLIELVAEFPSIGHIAIMAAPDTPDLNQVTSQLEAFCPRERIMGTDLSPVLTTHIGPRGLGVAVYEGEPIN